MYRKETGRFAVRNRKIKELVSQKRGLDRAKRFGEVKRELFKASKHRPLWQGGELQLT